MRGRQAVALVARREITERIREKSFLISVVVSLVIIALVAVLPSALGLGGTKTYTVGVADPAAQPVAAAAARGADAFDAELKLRRVPQGQTASALADGDVDVILTARGIRSTEKPDDALVNALQVANREVRAAEALRGAGLDPAEQRRAWRRRRSRSRPSSRWTAPPRSGAASRSSPSCCSTGS
jgi:ABC-2 type transport system permease protein